MKAERLTDDVTLYEGDCREVMQSLADGSVDHVITDPPYAEKTHAGARTTRPGKELTTVPIVTFDSIDDAAFLSLANECVRVAKRWVLMTCDWRHSAAAFCGGLPVVRCGVWVKPDAAPQFTGDRPGTGWEAVLILHRQGRKRWNGGGASRCLVAPRREAERPPDAEAARVGAQVGAGLHRPRRHDSRPLRRLRNHGGRGDA